jgi:hypothetical protein
MFRSASQHGHIWKRRTDRQSDAAHKKEPSERVREGEPNGERPRPISGRNLQITSEKMISHIRSMPTDRLDKKSVILMLKSMYTWFDPNS